MAVLPAAIQTSIYLSGWILLQGAQGGGAESPRSSGFKGLNHFCSKVRKIARSYHFLCVVCALSRGVYKALDKPIYTLQPMYKFYYTSTPAPCGSGMKCHVTILSGVYTLSSISAQIR